VTDNDDADDSDDICHSHMSVRLRGYFIMFLRKAKLKKK